MRGFSDKRRRVLSDLSEDPFKTYTFQNIRLGFCSLEIYSQGRLSSKGSQIRREDTLPSYLHFSCPFDACWWRCVLLAFATPPLERIRSQRTTPIILTLKIVLPPRKNKGVLSESTCFLAFFLSAASIGRPPRRGHGRIPKIHTKPKQNNKNTFGGITGGTPANVYYGWA